MVLKVALSAWVDLTFDLKHFQHLRGHDHVMRNGTVSLEFGTGFRTLA